MNNRAILGTKVPAVAKAVALLDDLARSADAASISEIARRTELPKSSVADIVSTLSRLGLLSRDRHGRYLLGHHVVELARGLVGGGRHIEVFAEGCDAAPEACNETVTLSILDGADVVIVAVRPGRVTLPITARVGLRLPAWSTASGRCFLDALPEAAIAEILASDSSTLAGVSGQLPTARQLAADLARERRQGFYVDDQSTATGMTSFSAPIERGLAGAVIAAVAIACRSDTLSAARLSKLGAAARVIAAEVNRLSRSAPDA